MSKAHVIGLGKSGVAAARLLKREGWEVEIGDTSTSPNLLNIQQELAAQNITTKLGYSLKLDDTSDLQLIVVSPGVSWDVPVIVQARSHGIETIGEMELAWRYLNNVPWVGITGTNGKTTTTSLVSAIFQTAGLNAPGCGNIGYAATEVALKYGGKENPQLIDWVIGEVSSYQIESASTLSPRIGIWTTFTPDHLARHKTLENYYNIKAKLLKQSELQILNGDDAYLHQVGLSQWENAYWTSVKGAKELISAKGFYLEDGWVMEKLTPTSTPSKVIPATALKMVGAHNLQNLLMAVAAARLAGIENDVILQAVREFPGVPHRVELICSWSGIQFINDSKATNYDAAEVGLKSVVAPAILIAGGEVKEGEDAAWLAAIQAKAAYVLLIGNAAEFFAQRLDSVGYTSYKNVGTMAKAVELAGDLATKYQAKSVLLSPACASFDQYANFEIRGDDFRQLCLAKFGG